MKNAEFYFETVKSLKSDKLTSVLVESNLYTNSEPTGDWVHVHIPTTQLTEFAVDNFDVLACVFAIDAEHVGFRFFHKGEKSLEFYFAGNSRFRSILDPLSLAKQRVVWAYPEEKLAANSLKSANTPKITKHIISELMKLNSKELNRILSLSCISVAPLLHKLTLEVSVPTNSDASLLVKEYLIDFVLAAMKTGVIDIIYLFVGLDEQDRVCCGRFAAKRYQCTK